MSAMLSRIREENYRVYVTDCLYSIGAAWNNPPRLRYYDILHPTPEDKRTGEEIAVERLERFGIKVVTDNGFDESGCDAVP